MEIFIIFVFVLVGLILITLEVLFLPGLIVGVFGGFLILAAIIYSTLKMGFLEGLLTTIISVIASIILFFIFKKLKVWDRFILKYEQKASSLTDMELIESNLVGKTGITITDLKPAGFILIDNRKLDALSEGEFIPKNCNVEIISQQGKKIIVKKVEEKL
jgi:membrane-bound ClpP family serine protease